MGSVLAITTLHGQQRSEASGPQVAQKLVLGTDGLRTIVHCHPSRPGPFILLQARLSTAAWPACYGEGPSHSINETSVAEKHRPKLLPLFKILCHLSFASCLPLHIIEWTGSLFFPVFCQSLQPLNLLGGNCLLILVIPTSSCGQGTAATGETGQERLITTLVWLHVFGGCANDMPCAK